jgi:hypothetical protein
MSKNINRVFAKQRAVALICLQGEMFSLMDFYYLLIICSINTNVSEKEFDTIQSDNMNDRP